MTIRSRLRRRVALLVALPLALGGCSSLQSSNSFLGFITPYRVEVQQGNVVTREQMAHVQPGMTRAQVRDALGSPLLTDPFHAERWDYVFTIRRPGAEPQVRRVEAHFAGDVLQRVETGGELPSEREFDDSIDTFKAPRTVPVLALTEAQLQALPQPKAPAAAASAAPPPARSYPPLEAQK
jgi:outer membrane protein assembly factor BamE